MKAKLTNVTTYAVARDEVGGSRTLREVSEKKRVRGDLGTASWSAHNRGRHAARPRGRSPDLHKPPASVPSLASSDRFVRDRERTGKQGHLRNSLRPHRLIYFWDGAFS